ncbi:hypothetical protein DMB65_00875 [Flavobacterium cheongpyeongense]|uniref:Uncharacterized protein n=1 Tax=Flavobacterium cheongpyeongense TaxID=2212651 RepID=A0A2V4BVG4_9FLAO|nr:hypothetical protein DMB65_00875 [Flavobacterium cheongpyeongense]
MTDVKPSATVIAGNINTATNEAQLAYEKSLQSQTEPTGMGIQQVIVPIRHYLGIILHLKA